MRLSGCERKQAVRTRSEFSPDGAMPSRPRLILVCNVVEAIQVLYFMLQCGVKFLEECENFVTKRGADARRYILMMGRLRRPQVSR